jgi:hypothetical protein
LANSIVVLFSMSLPRLLIFTFHQSVSTVTDQRDNKVWQFS